MNDKYKKDKQIHKELIPTPVCISTGVSSTIVLNNNINKGGILATPSILSTINSTLPVNNKIMCGSIATAIGSINKAQSLCLASKSIFKSMRHMNSAFNMVNSFKSLELPNSLAITSKAAQQIKCVNRISELIATQTKMIESLKSFKELDLSNYTLKDVIEVAQPEVLEKQLEFINVQEEPKTKSYMRENLVTILSLILMIITFVWSYYNAKETSKQNEKIISLLEQQNQIQIEKLREEKHQIKLINIQTELLKELIKDINSKINN